MLRALVLAAGNNSGRKMRDAYRGVRRVDVLAALAAGAIRVDAQIVGLDVDDDGVVDLGRDEHARKAGVATLGLVERRDADETMHAGFTLDKAESEIAADGEGCRFDAGFIAVLKLVDFRFEALPLGPAQIHAHEHLGPVLAFGAPGAGVYGDDRIQRVVFFRQHGAGFQRLGECYERIDLALEVGLDRGFAFTHQVEVSFDIVTATREIGIVCKLRFETLAFAHQRLRSCGIGPYGGVGNFLFNDGEFFFQAGRVKDTPADRVLSRGPGST